MSSRACGYSWAPNCPSWNETKRHGISQCIIHWMVTIIWIKGNLDLEHNVFQLQSRFSNQLLAFTVPEKEPCLVVLVTDFYLNLVSVMVDCLKVNKEYLMETGL
jgi:hypothetical protein